MIDTYDNTFVKTHRMYNIKAELMEFRWLWSVTVAALIMTMYHLLWDLTVGRLWVLRVESIKHSVSSAQFCCESKTALKIKYFLKGGNISKGHFSLILWSFGWCTIVSLWQLYLFKYSEPNFSPIQLLPAISLQFCTPHFVVRWYVARNCISLRKT